MRRRRNLLSSFAVSTGCFFAILSCTQAPDIPRLSLANRRSIEKIIIDEKLGPNDVRQILHALNEDGSIHSLVKFFDDLPDESIDGVTTALNRWLYDDGRLQKILSRRFDDKEFSNLAVWLESESKFAGAEDRRDLTYRLLSDERAPDFIKRLPGFLDPKIIDGWRTAEKVVEDQYKEIPPVKDKVLLATTAAEDIYRLFTGRYDKDTRENERDATRETVSLLLEKDAGDAIYRGLKGFAEQKNGVVGFEQARLGFQRMLEKAPEDFQKGAKRDNQLDLLLYLAEHTAAGSRGFFKALDHGLETHVDLIKKKKALFQTLVFDVYADRIRVQTSLPEYDLAYWKKLLETEEEGKAIRTLYQLVLEAWKPVVGPAGNASSPSYRLAVHLNAYVTAKWLYTNLKLNKAQFETFKAGTSFGQQLWAMIVVPKGIQVELVREEKNEKGEKTGVVTFPERDIMIEELKPIHDLMEMFYREKVEKPETYLYKVVDEPEMTLSEALFNALRPIDRKREIIGADTIVALAIQYLTRPNLGGGFVISSFETERLIDLVNRMVSVTSLERFRSLNRVLFGDLSVKEEKRKPGLLTPDINQVILELFSESPEHQPLVQKILWSMQSVAEFDFRETPESTTPFEMYRAVVGASYFEETNPHWVGQVLAYLSKIRAAGVIQNDDGSKQPAHPLFFDGLQSRSVFKKLSILSQLSPSTWAKLRAALAEFSDRAVADADLKLLVDAITPHKEGFTSGAAWWDKNPLPAGWDKPTPSEFDWLKDAISNGDHTAIIRFFKGANRKDWSRIAGDLQKLHRDGTLSRILKLLALIQDDRLRDFSRVLLKADSSGELGRLLDVLSLAAVPK